MSYSFAVHHIFPREVMELFSDNIDALFGGDLPPGSSLSLM